MIGTRCVMAAAAFAALSTAAIAGTADTGQARRIEIDLSNFKFTPDQITLIHGQPYVIAFVNRASGGHDFVAKQFFAAATIAPADRAIVSKGEVELDGGQSAEIHLIAPGAGTYHAHCSHFMHKSFGMKGEIVVR